MTTQTLNLRKKAAVAAADLLMLLLALCGALFSFLSSFPILADTGALLWVCVIAGLGALALFSLPKLWMRLTLSLLWLGWIGWTAWMNFSALVLGVLACAEQVGAVFAAKIGMGLAAPDFSAQTGNLTLAGELEVCTLLCTLVIALLALWLGWIIVGRRSFWPAAWSTFPFLLAPLSITITPEWLPLGALLLFWAAGLVTRLVRKRDPWGGAKTTFLALPAAALLLVLLGVLLPREAYENAPWVKSVRATAVEQLTMAGTQLLSSGSVSGPISGLAGGSVEVDLSSAGPLRFTGSTVLRVESEVTGHIYLRGFSAGRYTDKGWEQLGEEAYEEMREGWVSGSLPVSISQFLSSNQSSPGIGDAQPLNFPALADTASPNRRFTVENVGALTGYVYTPYQLSTTPGRMSGAEFINDAYLARGQGIRRFVLYARPGGSPGQGVLTGADALAEERYSAFVRRYYLGVPEDLCDTLDQILTRYNPLPFSYDPNDDDGYGIYAVDPIIAAESVAALLADLAEYDPDTPVTPNGQDFVSCFLTETNRGYCMHFASSATLLLRRMGIPARYTVGYTTDVIAGGTVEVPDENAHAWVEVYVDGYGWQPVEVTPGFPGDSVQANAAVTPSPSHTPNSTPAPSHTPAPKPSQEADTPGSGAHAERHIDWSRLFDPLWLIPPAVLFALGWLLKKRFERIQNRRRKCFYGGDVNSAVIGMYCYSERLLRYHADEEMGPIPEALGQKAKFSTHTLSEDERIQMLSYTTGLAVRTYYLLGWWKRHFYRYFVGLC